MANCIVRFISAKQKWDKLLKEMEKLSEGSFVRFDSAHELLKQLEEQLREMESAHRDAEKG